MQVVYLCMYLTRDIVWDEFWSHYNVCRCVWRSCTVTWVGRCLRLM